MSADRLAGALSPFLRRHAQDPVNWFPWGAEAVELAASEDRPVLLSVGSVSNHFCRVMQLESFQQPGIARLMNEHFVCILVDREQHPEVENFYLSSALLMNRESGCPLNVFLTPEMSPFFAGTYYAAADSADQLGWLSLLSRIADLWARDRDELFRQGSELVELVRGMHQSMPPRTIRDRQLLGAVDALEASFDAKLGGFGHGGKFYQPAVLEFLLRRHAKSPEPRCLKMLVETLDAIRHSPLRDPLGFGFARCSSDPAWRLPHWERMLYDNAQLATVYLDAGCQLDKPAYLQVARETLDFIVSELQEDDGGLVTSVSPAEGNHDYPGPFFCLSVGQLREALKPEELAAVSKRFGIATGEGATDGFVLRDALDVSEVAEVLKQPLEAVVARLHSATGVVQTLREGAVCPLADKKTVAAYQGLGLRALAQGALSLGDERYLACAFRVAEHLRRVHWVGDSLLRVALDGEAGGDGALEDYAFCADGLLALYEASGVADYRDQAFELIEQLLRRFRGADGGLRAFEAQEPLLLPLLPAESHDAALPSASAVAARALLRAGTLSGRSEWIAAATGALRAQGQRVARNPRAQVSVLNAADAAMGQVLRIAVVDSSGGELLCALGADYSPDRVIGHVKSPGLGAGWPDAKPGPGVWFQGPGGWGKAATDVADVRARHRAALAALRAQGPGTLSGPVLAGRATPDGTRAYFKARRLPAHSARELASTGLVVSRLGFGGYRVHEDVLEQRRALELALSEGCNLVDTAPSYTQGASERLIGAALSSQVASGGLGREQVVVITKVGLSSEPLTALPEGAVSLGGATAYCLNPLWLERSLRASIERLELEAVDVVLLHSPELLLSVMPRAEALAALRPALVWLQEQFAQGRISSYGVSCSVVGGSRGFDFAELASAVRDAGASGFGVVQLPLNPLETEPLAETPSSLGWVSGASSAGWAVLAHRPLNALVGDTLVRLADAPSGAPAGDYAAARDEVAKLEHEFRAQLGAVLLAVPDIKLPVGEFFAWSDRVTDYEMSSRELWDDFEREIIGGHLPGILVALNRAFADKKLEAVWRRWRDRYTRAVEDWILAARARASAATDLRNLGFRQELVQRAPDALKAASLSRLVLWNLSSLDGVTSVLVGMRSSAHVQDALGTTRWQEAEEPLEDFAAAAAALREFLNARAPL